MDTVLPVARHCRKFPGRLNHAGLCNRPKPSASTPSGKTCARLRRKTVQTSRKRLHLRLWRNQNPHHMHPLLYLRSPTRPRNLLRLLLHPLPLRPCTLLHLPAQQRQELDQTLFFHGQPLRLGPLPPLRTLPPKARPKTPATVALGKFSSKSCPLLSLWHLQPPPSPPSTRSRLTPAPMTRPRRNCAW